MEILHLSDEEVAEDHNQLLGTQNSLDYRVKVGEAKKKALRAVLANTLDPHGDLPMTTAMASSMKRTIIETRLGEVDHPVQEAADHQLVAQNFSRLYGGQLHEQAKIEMQSGL